MNSVHNLQASALFVLGQHWVVLRAYVMHVVLLTGGTWLLLRPLGIAGYGWAELLACLAYLGIHNRLTGATAISYRRLVPLVTGFLPVLFIPFAPRVF